MTERKPPWESSESWVERQIAAALQRGEFDDLPGAGKPLPKPNGHDGVTEWALQRIKAGDLDASALLPPSLALRRELQDLPAKLAGERTERKVRELVADLNERIREACRRPQIGPPLTVAPVDVEEAVAQWREAREPR